MKMLTQKDLDTLFTNLCCSRCKNEFKLEDLKEIKRDGDIIIYNLHCHICSKDFGEVVLNFNRKAEKHTPLEIIEGSEPINYDDVIYAHKFIKENL